MTARSGIKRWVPLLKILLAVVLIAIVLSQVPLRDRLTLPRPSGTETISGRLDFSERQIVFTAHQDKVRYTLDLVAAEIVRLAIERPGEPREVHEAKDETWLSQVGYERGLITLMKGIRAEWFLLGLCCYLLASMIAAWRWRALLRSTGVPAGWLQVLRLTFIGLFCNNFVPGLTGGDVIKAIYVARAYPEQRADAVISVLVDRVMGILGLAVIAATAVLIDPARFREVFLSIYGFLAALVIGALAFFSRRVRRRLRIDALLRRMPFSDLLQKIDRSIYLYRHRAGTLGLTLGMSLVVHTFILTGMGFLGRSLGMQMPFHWYFVLVPVAFIAQSVPITPQGFGVGEGVLIFYFGTAGVAKSEALALMLCYRIVMTAASLVGGAFLATERRRDVAESSGDAEATPVEVLESG